MADPLTKYLQARFRERRQGTVISTSSDTVTVNMGGRTVILRRTNAIALKPGDRVNVAGEQIVGKRKPPPRGATYEI